MKIKLQLADVVRNDAACRELELNWYYLSEWGESDEWVEMEVEDAFRFGLLRRDKKEE